MTKDKHYNPLLERRLYLFFRDNGADLDGDGLCSFLSGLSNADFRTAGFLLGERILPTFTIDCFWTTALCLWRYNAKAFWGTLLKSLAQRRGGVDLHHPKLEHLVECLNTADATIDKQKFLVGVLPLLSTPEDIRHLFDMLHVTHAERIAEYLLHTGGMLCYYMLFQLLRSEEGNTELAETCCRRLMKKGDGLSFNMASVFKLYFSLDAIKGTFSLSLAPYELSCLEQSYESFVKIVSRV